MEDERAESHADELAWRKDETKELEQIIREMEKQSGQLEKITKLEKKLIRQYEVMAELRTERERLEKLQEDSGGIPIL